MSTVTEKFTASAPAAALATAALGPHLELLQSVVEADDTAQAVREVFRRRSPKEHEADEKLSDILDEPYNGICCAFMEAALAVGIQIGRALAANGAAPGRGHVTVDGNPLPDSLGGRIAQAKQLLLLIEGSAGAFEKLESTSWSEEYPAAIRRAAGDALEELYWCVENVPAAVLATPALTDDDSKAGAR